MTLQSLANIIMCVGGVANIILAVTVAMQASMISKLSRDLARAEYELGRHDESAHEVYIYAHKKEVDDANAKN